MSVGEEIRKWRSIKRITMPQLSKSVGAPASTIYLWEKNRIVPDAQEIAALAKAFGVPVSDLTGIAAPARPDKKAEPAPKEPSVVTGSGSGFDMMLVTRVYHCIRDEAGTATPVELAATRNLLQESIKIVKARIREQNERRKAAE